jgi:hypothetical protein
VSGEAPRLDLTTPLVLSLWSLGLLMLTLGSDVGSRVTALMALLTALTLHWIDRDE